MRKSKGLSHIRRSESCLGFVRQDLQNKQERADSDAGLRIRWARIHPAI